MAVNYFIVFALLWSAIAEAQEPAYESGALHCSRKRMQAVHERSNRLNEDAFAYQPFDVLDYSLNLDIYDCFFLPYPRHFKAANKITLRVDSAMNQLWLDADTLSLAIDSVSPPCSSFNHINNRLTILLDQTYFPPDTIVLTIWCRHNNINDDAFYAGDGLVFTDSQPERARKWFPCRDFLGDKATLDLIAKVPLSARLGSNGRLQDSLVVGDTLYYHWVSRDPMVTYNIVIAGKVNYLLDQVYWHPPTNPADSIPIRFYYHPGEDIQPVKQLIIPLTNFFSERFVNYPFEKNGFASLNNDFYWGGMENQTLITLRPDYWGAESLIVHEYAHQWFGDMITCKTWADIFLHEGFATWCEAFWKEQQSGYAAYHAELNGNANYYKYFNPGWPISVSEWANSTPSMDTLFNTAITYYKSSCVLHQLRYVLGDSLFFAGMKAYASDPALQYGSATITDFREVMETVSGQDLVWFFDEWIFAPNHPVYNNTYYFENLVSGQWKVWFTINQIQTNTVFFKMPVEVRIKFTNGPDTLIRIMNDINHQSYQWEFDRQPIQFKFDPNNHLLLKNATLMVGAKNIDAATCLSPKLYIYPNPCKGSTTIEYELEKQAYIQLVVIDPFGHQVVCLIDGMQPAGRQQVQWMTWGIPAGVYFCMLQTGNSSAAGKMILLK